jgi:hypothetical protein
VAGGCNFDGYPPKAMRKKIRFCYACEQEEILKMITTIFEQYKSGELQSYNLPEFIKNYERSALTGQLAYCFEACIGGDSCLTRKR